MRSMIRTTPSSLSLLASFALAALFLLPSPTAALSFGPPSTDLDMDPGQTFRGTLQAFNEDAAAITVYPLVMNFEADIEEQGTPQMYPANEDRLGQGLATWVTLDRSAITLAPGDRKELSYSITVPKGAQPGGHYGAIILSTKPPGQREGSVGIDQQIASLLLVRVSGEVQEKGSIAEFGFVDAKVSYDHLPVDFFMRFENAGNTHLRPVGTLLIQDVFGREVATIRVNDALRSVLPLSIRRFEFGWSRTQEDASEWSELTKEWKNFAIGKYTATLILNYGTTDQIVTDQRVFYVWPWRLMSLVGFGAVILALFFPVLKGRYDNKLVIKGYEQKKRTMGNGT
jgi:hypothetical protein